MSAELRILLVEDDIVDTELALRTLSRAGCAYRCERVDTEQAFRHALATRRPDIILSDYTMPTFSGAAALVIAKELTPDVPFIYVSGTLGEEHAIQALHEGADDYVLKANLLRLPVAVQRALERTRARAVRAAMERELRESHQRFEALLESAPDGIVLVDGRGMILLANAAVERVFGYRRDELLGRSIDVLVPDAHRAAHSLHRQGYLASPTPRQMASTTELQGRRKDGSLVPVEVGLSPLAFKQDLHVIGIVRDVTERHEQQHKIARLSRIHAIMSEINSVIVRVHDRALLLADACRIAVQHGGFGIARIADYDRERREIVPVASAGLAQDSVLMASRLPVGADDPASSPMLIRAIEERCATWCNDLPRETGSGSPPWQHEVVRRGYLAVITLPLVVDDVVEGIFTLFATEVGFFDAEEVQLLSTLAGDIAFALQYLKKDARLDYLAFYDQVTDLPNRTLFTDRLGHMLRAARHDDGKVALVLQDIKRFRLINESLGHAAGDELLREFAKRLKAQWPDPDNVARIASDCLAGIVRDYDDEGEIAQLLQAWQSSAVARLFTLGGQDIEIATTAGVAVFPADGSDAETLLNNAEAALKKAKAANERYLFYRSEMNAAVAQSLALENRLHRALERDQYVLFYQPRIELATDRISGLEALIRWQDPDFGLVPPSRFIPILEDTGMILDVGRWAIERAVAQFRQWHRAGLRPPRIAVNVSAIQLRQSGFVDMVRDAIAAAGGSGHGLDLEITESLIMEDTGENIVKLRALRDMGINISIDDFGTGHSSLSYLTKLPVNALKIDRSFVSAMFDSAENATLVSTIISLAHSLDLKVVAEGVESEDQKRTLHLLKCDEVQGFLFWRPLPADAVGSILGQIRGSGSG